MILIRSSLICWTPESEVTILGYVSIYRTRHSQSATSILLAKRLATISGLLPRLLDPASLFWMSNDELPIYSIRSLRLSLSAPIPQHLFLTPAPRSRFSYFGRVTAPPRPI